MESTADRIILVAFNQASTVIYKNVLIDNIDIVRGCIKEKVDVEVLNIRNVIIFKMS